uniref:PABS domain-containing protein n=2 Tax=Lotharella globosa TaxID=91324 RepID=A0A7S4DQZ5_9EUKA
MAFHEINGKKWFTEINDQWRGQALSLQVDEMLFDERSKFQHVQVFRSKSPFGNVLLLDGVIQITDLDECAYQEMITHLPMCSHINPERVLVIGGGDGGVIREVCRHDCVKEIVICEIDKMVIEAGKKFFPKVAAAWEDKRVNLFCGDGAGFVAEKKGYFDIIICDSSDPVGPATSLFTEQFYESMRLALRPGGKVCTQAETTWLDLDLIQRLKNAASQRYDNVQYAYTQIPTYPCGMIGFLLCSLSPERKTSETATTEKGEVNEEKELRRTLAACDVPRRELPSKVLDQLKYYSKEMHSASFVLPAFARRVIYEGAEVERSNKTKIIDDEKAKSKETTKSKTDGE